VTAHAPAAEVRLGARLSLELLSSRRPWVVAALGLVGVELVSLLERSREPAYAADRALHGATLGVVMPLVCYALFEAVYGKDRTASLLDPIGRHGANRRRLSLGVNAALSLGCAVTSAVLAAVAAVSAHGFGGPSVFADCIASLWGGALAGAAYAGFFAVASPFGRRGRIAALVLDWLFGSGAGLFAVVWPRGHARNLFGGEPVLDASQTVAALVLAVFAIAGVGFAAARETR
jgi:hypothetical protein